MLQRPMMIPREHQVSWGEFRDELPRYGELVDFPVSAVKLLPVLPVVVTTFPLAGNGADTKTCKETRCAKPPVNRNG